MEGLGEALVQSAEASIAEPVPPGTYYPGGWLAGGWLGPHFQPEIHLALLYYPRLLVHDPLSSYFFDRFDDLPKMKEIRMVNRTSRSHIAAMYAGPDVFAKHAVYATQKVNPEQALEWFKGLIRSVVSFAPLIDDGILILRPQWPTILARKEALMASVRHDVRTPEMISAAEYDPAELTRWDNIRGGKLTVGGGIPHPADIAWTNQEEFFYLAKTLAVADQAGATYVPSTDADYELLRAKAISGASKIRGIQQHPEKLLEEVSRLVVPSLKIDPKTTVRVRQDEESFDSWRRELSTLARDSKDDDAEELAARVEDMLIPRIRELNRSLQRSRPLRDNLIADGASIVVAAGVGAAAGGPTGAALAAGMGALPGVIGWLFKAYQRPNLSGSDTVLARLIQK